MPPVLSKYDFRKCSYGILSAASLYVLIKAINKYRFNKKKTKQEDVLTIIPYAVTQKTEVHLKAHVNKQFLKQLWSILKIIIPRIISSEFGYLILIALSLIARSLCDMWLIRTATIIETEIVNLRKQQFVYRLLTFSSIMPIVAAVNNILKYAIGELKIKFRKNLTYYLYDEYLRGYTYYKMSNLDNRIVNADQLLTTDVDKFCNSVTNLYSNISKPTLDIFIYVYQLTSTLGYQTPSLLFCYLVVSGLLLTYLRRPIGGLTVNEQKLEGEFRYINSRLITNSEEVAFYNGNYREKLALLSSFNKLMAHARKFLRFRVLMGIVDDILAKYLATVVGFIAVSLPFLDMTHSRMINLSQTERYAFYYTMGRMLVKLAESVGRLVLAGRELTQLAGFTSRIINLIHVLNDINEGHYVRGTVQLENSHCLNSKGRSPSFVGSGGQIIFQDNMIKFDKVPLVTPNGDILIKTVSFEVISGMNVLICGPNGCGKSSLFRILGELWPLQGGTLTKPQARKLFYIPQKPYMPFGTLRDQIIYPCTKDDMNKAKLTDKHLEEHLHRVQLFYLLNREGGWDAVADWADVLSGGEKQRIAMARLFFHAPQFAILDECTSAVSVDVEGSMYQYCKEIGITLFTVSHRRSLWKYHEYCLQMDGRGEFEFKKIELDTEEFGS